MNLDVKKYVRQWLYPSRRKPKFLQYLYALVTPISELWNSFAAWRVQQYYDVNITGQTFSLQEHLNNLFDNALRRIYIAHYDDLGFYVPLESEGYATAEIGLEVEDVGEFVALQGEIQQTIGVSFNVYIPTELNVDLVISELLKYKLAGRSFQVIES